MRFRKSAWVLLIAIFVMPYTSIAQISIKKKADKNYQIHNYKEAIKNYLRYIDRNKQSESAKARLADSYRHINNLKEAAKWYEEVVGQLQVDNPNVYFEYGLTLKGLGKYEEARKWFLKFAETNPEKGIHYASSCQFAQQKTGSPAAYKLNAEFVNTAAADFAPAFFNDQLVFASSRIDYNNSNKIKDEINLPFISRRDQNNYLLKPALLHQRISSGNEGPLSYSANGKRVAITRNNFVNGVRQIPSSGVNLNIQIAEALPNGEWQNEKYFPYNGTNFSTAYPSFSADGKTLYFASNRPDGFGGFDIFVTYYIGNTWTTPENLGPTVNTPGNEISPFFDGQDLYFSSDWHDGMGGLDVFRAAKSSGTWDRVYHLDTQINSPRDDYGFIYDKNRNLGYIVSNRAGGKGNEDIYRISKASDNLEIIVLDEFSMQPIVGADIDFSSCGQPSFVTDISGRHILQIPQGLNCQAIIRKDGYASSTLNVAQSQLGGAQSLQILLKRSTQINQPTNPVGSNFTGRIYDISTGRDIRGVFVTAIDQRTGLRLESITDDTGLYALSLEPFKNYLIRYAKIGYADASREVNTGSGQESNILGSYPLRSIGTTPPIANPTPSNPTPPSNPNPSLGTGFSIQVAAFQSTRTSDLSRFKPLENIGNVYNRYQGNTTKVRVGVFATRDEAVQAAKDIKRKGFSDCFVVAETLDDLGTGALIADADIPKGQNQGYPYSAYKVRLASYRNPQYFQRSAVERYGLIESKVKGPWTIMLLGGFANVEEAQRAAQSAVSAGFPQAHVVFDNGTELTKVR